MTYPDLPRLEPHIRSATGLVIDLDGTLMSGGQLYPDTKPFLESLSQPFVILSNDSEHTSADLVQVFGDHGVALNASHFILAGVALVEEFAKAEPGARVMILGSPALQALATDRGLVLDDARPEAVIVMRDPGFTYRRLALAAGALFRGARMIVACPDVSHPSPSGAPVPEAGALAAAVRICAGIDEYTVFGKPEPALFELASRRLGLAPSDCAMIGDNPHTDGAGASRLGMKFYQITRPRNEDLECAA